MTVIDQQLFEELVDLLTPYMTDENGRQSWLQLAVGDSPVYRLINFAGPPHTFTVQMIATLLNHGEVSPGVEAIGALLNVMKTQVGGNKQQTIEQLQMKLIAFFTTQQGSTNSAKQTNGGWTVAQTAPVASQPTPGGIHFSGATTQIEGDVIVGGVVNKTIMQGPATTSGDGSRNQRQSHPSSASDVREFTNIWYTPKQYRFFQWRRPDLGVLALNGDQVLYLGEKYQLTLAHIQAVTHMRMPGDINHNWVKVVYLVNQTPVSAYFACANKLGIGFLLGGSETLYHALRALLR